MKKAAILLENVFDERELIYPYYRLLDAGYEVHLVGTEAATIYTGKQGLTQESTHASKDVGADLYDVLIIPGGFSPDYMRRSQATRDFVAEMDRQKKTIGAICHGPWMLASAADISGKDVTAFYSIKDDMTHAGANYIDREVVVDGHIVTSRTVGDLVPFMQAVLATALG